MSEAMIWELVITPLKAIKDMLLFLFDFIDLHFYSTKIEGLDAAHKRLNTQLNRLRLGVGST